MPETKYEEWQKKHPNFVTPELLKYESIDGYVVELSRGYSIRGMPIYGVTLLEETDDGYKPYTDDKISKPFFVDRDAEKYYSNLKNAVNICRPFEGSTFKNCLVRELDKRM